MEQPLEYFQHLLRYNNDHYVDAFLSLSTAMINKGIINGFKSNDLTFYNLCLKALSQHNDNIDIAPAMELWKAKWKFYPNIRYPITISKWYWRSAATSNNSHTRLYKSTSQAFKGLISKLLTKKEEPTGDYYFNTKHVLSKGILKVNKPNSGVCYSGPNWHSTLGSAINRSIIIIDSSIKKLEEKKANFLNLSESDLKYHKSSPIKLNPSPRPVLNIYDIWLKNIKRYFPKDYKSITAVINNSESHFIMHIFPNVVKITSPNIPKIIIYSDPNYNNALEFCNVLNIKNIIEKFYSS